MAIGLPHYVDQNDLVSAGLLGLIQAVDNFDIDRGIKFETFAIPRIRGAILDELRTQDWFPRSLRRKARMLDQAFSSLEIRLGRPATDDEVAKELGITRKELAGLMDEVAVATIISLDADASGESDENSTAIGEYLSDPKSECIEDQLSEQEMIYLVSGGLEDLPEKEQLVLVLYYYEDLTLKEIGTILDVTESRVCQIHTKAIFRLKSKLTQTVGRKSIDRLSKDINKSRNETIVKNINDDEKKAPVNFIAGIAVPSMLLLARAMMDLQLTLLS
jgi:RNA polymerase sigma factor FliA